MKYCYKEIIIPIAGLIAIVLLVYMEKIWSVMSGFDAATITDTITAIASVFIAGLALWVSMRADKRNEEQARLSNERRETQARVSDMRKEMQANLSNERSEKQARLSVRPMLRVETNLKVSHSWMYSDFKLVNCGIGPAVIKSFVLMFDNKEVVRDSSQDYYAFLEKEHEGFSVVPFGSIIPGSVIKAEEVYKLWTIKYKDTQESTNATRKLTLLVYYQSIYEDEIFSYDSRVRLQFTGRE